MRDSSLSASYSGGSGRRGWPNRNSPMITWGKLRLWISRPGEQRAGRCPIASLAGAWTALVAGFGGMRLHNGSLSFAPRLPDGIIRLAFHILFRGHRLRVEVTKTEATYSLHDDSPLKVRHHSDEITLPANGAVSRPSSRRSSGTATHPARGAHTACTRDTPVVMMTVVSLSPSHREFDLQHSPFITPIRGHNIFSYTLPPLKAYKNEKKPESFPPKAK